MAAGRTSKGTAAKGGAGKTAEPRRAGKRPSRSRRPVTLVVEGVVKRYGERAALAGVDLEAREGELVAVVGPNGAGKTTLLSIIAGILRPDQGKVHVERGQVGWVPQQAALYRRLTVAENLRLFARLEEVEDVEATVERMLKQSGLADRRHDQVSSLSGGNQQRINIAIGLLGNPSVLLLDEPSAGLDPRQRVRLWELVSGFARQGTTVIYSTHQIEEASRYGDRLLVLADGEALFDGTLAAMRRAAGRRPRGAHTDPEADFIRFLERERH